MTIFFRAFVVLAWTLALSSAGAQVAAPTPSPTPTAAQSPAPSQVVPTSRISANFIWIEGENTLKTNVPMSGWVKGEDPKLLSGGDALSGLSKPDVLPKPCYALYQFECTAEGTYDLFFRHGTMGNIGAMRYRFVKLGAEGKPVKEPGAEEGWLTFDRDAPIMDRRVTGQYRTIEWTKQPQVRLEKGSYYLDIQITGQNPSQIQAHDTTADVWILIDAICLTTEPFTPSGAHKPGEKTDAAGAVGAGTTSYY